MMTLIHLSQTISSSTWELTSVEFGGTAAAAPSPSGLATLPSVGAVP